MSYPLTDLTVELTQKCIQNCLYCSSGSSITDCISLPVDIVTHILDNFYCLGGKTIEFSGGEPLLYNKIEDTINYASKIGLAVHLFTSGNVDVDLETIKNVDKVFVNLQAPNKATHDYLTQTPGSFDKVIEFIKKMKNANKWVGTHVIPLSVNIDELEEYLQLAKFLNLDNISLLRFVEQGRGKKTDLPLNKDEIKQLFDFIINNKNIENLEIKAGCPIDFAFIYKKGQIPIPCKAGINRCLIRATGDVIPCPAFKDTPDYVAGNIRENNLIEIWNTSKVFRSLRAFDYKKLKGKCETCAFVKACKGRCTAQRLLNGSDFNKGPDPYCPLIQN
jgi:radical SAM protein with 4Fe4S-binding SPASM domain